MVLVGLLVLVHFGRAAPASTWDAHTVSALVHGILKADLPENKQERIKKAKSMLEGFGSREGVRAPLQDSGAGVAAPADSIVEKLKKMKAARQKTVAASLEAEKKREEMEHAAARLKAEKEPIPKESQLTEQQEEPEPEAKGAASGYPDTYEEPEYKGQSDSTCYSQLAGRQAKNKGSTRKEAEKPVVSISQ